ncbi:MAG TPA: DEAD/DEAH box helicase [Myxococcaceae bacterium]|nr:DEAD/DEAH box helicase [Myxococcaceae bacterium]
MSTESISDPDFHALGLSPAALRAVSAAGFSTPTPIQSGAIPPALAGADVIGCAATGTGKTAAYLLPILERLSGKTGTRTLVLAPTRELAVQIAQAVEVLGREARVRPAVVIGGVGQEGQRQALRERRPILVATPGRLVDHLESGTARLDEIEILVLDEADRMLDMGFAPQLRRVMARLPAKRQTLLFSATMAGEVAEFARKHLRSPVRVEVARSGTTAPRASQQIYRVSQTEKNALLQSLLDASGDSTLVFVRTRRRADKIARVLERAGHRIERLHSDRSQVQRQRALESFRRGQVRVLVATDIAARGIDVADIGHVVNYDLPHVPEDYVHRIGRTARAAASGRASSFVAPDEGPLLQAIERLTRTRIPEGQVPRNEPAFAAALAEAAALQRSPGPPQRTHGVSSRPAGQQPGRHARTHGRGAIFSGAPRRATGRGARTAAGTRWS